MSDHRLAIDGFDPLVGNGQEEDEGFFEILEEANRRIIHNILKSYTGYFDLFSETIQNSLDAVQMRRLTDGDSYTPRIWITIDIPNSKVRIVDNGVGMDEKEIKFCLRPNVSFKSDVDLRGHKGVGATFLAYGFSFLKLQSKKDHSALAVILRQGRQWAEDNSKTIPRPKFQQIDFEVNELIGDKSGTSVEIMVGQSSGERPKNLGWLGAHTAEQWLDLLRLKTPLGGVYLRTPPFSPTVDITVYSPEGTETQTSTSRAEYYYPHEIPNMRVQSLRDIQNAINEITGDSSTKFTKLGNEFKKLDCIYDVWDKDELLNDHSYFISALNDEQKQLIEKHNVTVYASFLRSAKMWAEFNDDILKLRKGTKIVHGGLQIATDFMVQGDLLVIPLTSAIGYQANSHVIVHFIDGNPDMGRKVFQPELKELSEAVAVRSVNTIKKFLEHLKPDTGAQTLIPERELHEWKKNQESYRDKYPLSHDYEGKQISIVSLPQQEQDVIALFHELIGIGRLKGYKFFATSQNDKYDSLFYMDYPDDKKLLFDESRNKLGVSRNIPLPYYTEPKVLEYKYTFDSLVHDLENNVKFTKQIDLVVCWQLGRLFKERFWLQSFLVGDEGMNRNIYGSTHRAYMVGAQSEPAFEIVVLDDFLRWLQDPSGEEARQKQLFRDQ